MSSVWGVSHNPNCAVCSGWRHVKLWDSFLKAHEVYISYTVDDLNHDLNHDRNDLRRLGF